MTSMVWLLTTNTFTDTKRLGGLKEKYQFYLRINIQNKLLLSTTF